MYNEPIKVSATITKTGRIKIRFSRSIKIDFDQGSKEKQRRRFLIEETYSDEEKKQLTSMIIIDYDP